MCRHELYASPPPEKVSSTTGLPVGATGGAGAGEQSRRRRTGTGRRGCRCSRAGVPSAPKANLASRIRAMRWTRWSGPLGRSERPARGSPRGGRRRPPRHRGPCLSGRRRPRRGCGPGRCRDPGSAGVTSTTHARRGARGSFGVPASAIACAGSADPGPVIRRRAIACAWAAVMRRVPRRRVDFRGDHGGTDRRDGVIHDGDVDLAVKHAQPVDGLAEAQRAQVTSAGHIGCVLHRGRQLQAAQRAAETEPSGGAAERPHERAWTPAPKPAIPAARRSSGARPPSSTGPPRAGSQRRRPRR